MIVVVNPEYSGTFGCRDEKLDTVHTKRAGDPPFSVPDNDAKRLIDAGVLSPTDGKETPKPEVKAPEITAETPEKKETPKKAAAKK